MLTPSSLEPVLAAVPLQAGAPASALALEARLRAPCCWVGTLDVHESDLAHALRDEIATRLGRGETAETVQADFVARYGERVVAARSDQPLRAMSLGLAALVVVALVALVLRWRRHVSAPPRRVVAAVPDSLDARIDAALADMEG